MRSQKVEYNKIKMTEACKSLFKSLSTWNVDHFREKRYQSCAHRKMWALMFQGGLLVGTHISNPIQYNLSKDQKHTSSKLSTITKPAKPLGTEMTSDHHNTSSSSFISLWLFVAAFPEVWCLNCQHKHLQSCNVLDNGGTSSECSMGHSWDAPGPCDEGACCCCHRTMEE